MKKYSHIPTESIERQHYKKGYISRILEQKEADKEIEHFKTRSNRETSLSEHLQNPPSLEEEGYL